MRVILAEFGTLEILNVHLKSSNWIPTYLTTLNGLSLGGLLGQSTTAV